MMLFDRREHHEQKTIEARLKAPGLSATRSPPAESAVLLTVVFIQNLAACERKGKQRSAVFDLTTSSTSTIPSFTFLRLRVTARSHPALARPGTER